MMTETVMKGETSGANRLKVDSRPPLHKRRCSSKSVTGPEEMHSDSEQNINNEMSTMEPSAEISSTDNHMTLEQINVSREDSKETRQLKELLLVHLDMITQQQEILMAKDRQIRTLKSEKEALKCRLERMERRMSLLKQKSPAVGPALGPALGGGGDLDLHVNTTQHHVRAINFSAGGDQQQQHPRALKRKSTADGHPLSKRHASGSTASPGQTGGDPTDYAHHSPRRLHHHQQQNTPKSAFGVRHFSRTPFNPLSTDTGTGNDSDSTSRTMSPSRGGNKHQDEEPERGILDSVKERLKPVVAPEDAEYFHRTDRMYYVPWEVPLSPQTKISPKKVQDPDVKVPSFRVKHIQTGYSMEGTENLDDEIFAKRHGKPELEEKRRKRWDMQRLREQRLYEKLQGKKQTRIQPIKLKHGKVQDTEGPPESFIPDPNEVRYIEICDNVPVSAFGYPVPQLEECEFDLPDFDLDKRDSDEVKRSSRKKR